MGSSGAESMIYSFPLEHSGHVHFSPNCRMLATAASHRLVVRDADSLQILHIFSCLDRVDRLGWS